jgi:hypothetical protein
VALTAKQRNALPNSAFAYPKSRKYPVPTKAQARAAGISERQRLATHRKALARSAQRQTSGTHGHVRSQVALRHGGGVASLRGSSRGAGRGGGGRGRR